MIWNLINTGYNAGSYNMGFDEREAIRLAHAGGYPTLRFYGWKPHAISIGYNQDMNDFDSIRISDAGIDIVRRPTGGRAILHSDEITYSVVMQIEDKGPRTLYKFINEGLLHGLRYLGVDAELTGIETNLREFYREPSSIPCFSGTAKSEIHCRNRKLVGSAQRRYDTVILQHGSILLGPDHKKIVDFLASHLIEKRQILREEIDSKTIDLQEVTGRHIPFNEAAEALTQGFADIHGIIFEQKEFVENA